MALNIHNNLIGVFGWSGYFFPSTARAIHQPTPFCIRGGSGTSPYRGDLSIGNTEHFPNLFKRVLAQIAQSYNVSNLLIAKLTIWVILAMCVAPKLFGVSTVFGVSGPLQVLYAIICFVGIFVINNRLVTWVWDKCQGNESVYKDGPRPSARPNYNCPVIVRVTNFKGAGDAKPSATYKPAIANLVRRFMAGNRGPIHNVGTIVPQVDNAQAK